jgi:hypothetical protein
MLFVYAFLARWEEQRCVARFGDAYRRYAERMKARSLGRLATRLPVLPAGGGRRAAALLALYLGAVVASVGIGRALHSYSLARVPGFYLEDAAVLSPALLSEDELARAWNVASGKEVAAEIAAAGHGSKLIVYVVPADWELPDLPMPVPEERHGGHYKPRFDRRVFRVLFTTARAHRRDIRGREIVEQAYGRDAQVIVRIDLQTGAVLGREEPPPHVRWGDIPTPLF